MKFRFLVIAATMLAFGAAAPLTGSAAPASPPPGQAHGVSASHMNAKPNPKKTGKTNCAKPCKKPQVAVPSHP